MIKNSRALVTLASLVFVGLGLALPALAQTAPNDACAAVKMRAEEARDKTKRKAQEEADDRAKKAKEASSCLARAGDGILRAAIPPSLGSILGVLSDPLGYATSAMTNAACSVMSTQADKVARGASDINGAIRKSGNEAQGVFTGTVNKTVGGAGDYYPVPKPANDPGFFQTMSCRLFGRC